MPYVPQLLVVALCALALALPRESKAQPAGNSADRKLDSGTRATVIDALIGKLDANYIYPDVAKRMEDAIRLQQSNKAYDRITDANDFAKALTEDLQRACGDKHLGVEYSAVGGSYDSEQPPDPEVVKRFREQGRRVNFQFKKVERLDGGIGYLQLNGFYPGEWIGDTLAAAMAFLANCDAIILDFRVNHGGFGNGGTLLCSYFFDDETHLTDQYNRSKNVTHQIWTYPIAQSARLADKPLYILVSSETFSAPESLAYAMQAVKRATIVGETTGGGAHGTTMFRLDDQFSASIPFNCEINPVTKTDWERVGVKPDVAVPANQALLMAHLLALKSAVKKYGDDQDYAAQLNTVIAAKEKELEAMKSAAKQ